eukprot:jgi/Mesvir1/29082/Mv18388-RA.1
MELQNIGQSNSDDAFYRYKMPKLVAKIEGRGNGIKTNVVNMVDVAKALERPPSYTTKFFGCELGAQSKFDEATNIAIVNGAHETSKLAELLEIFIKKFVQCYSCGNPETDINITKTDTIFLKCKACGAVSDVDMRHRLTTFILKNPPTGASKGGKAGKKDKKDKKADREQKKKEEEEEKKRKKEERKKKKEEKALRKAAEAASGAGPSNGNADNDDDDDEDEDEDAANCASNDDEDDEDVEWLADTSEAAAKARMEEQLTDATSAMVDVAIEDKKKKSKKKESPEDKLIKELKDMLADKSKSLKDVAAHLDSAGVKDKQLETDIFFAALFEDSTDPLPKTLRAKLPSLKALVRGPAVQQCLLHTLEAYCSVKDVASVKDMAAMLKLLYDADVVEEEPILAWYNFKVASEGEGVPSPVGGSVAVRKSAAPFVEWLENAESESDEED